MYCRYGANDKRQYEPSQYLADINGDGVPDTRKDFEPNFDMHFGEFKAKMAYEWKMQRLLRESGFL